MFRAQVGKLAKPPFSDSGVCGFDSHSGHSEMEFLMIDAYRSIVKDKNWFVFENGTCIIADDEKTAKEKMAKYGPVKVATPSADFFVADKGTFWLVFYNYKDMFNYVGKDEADRSGKAGMVGRSKRTKDAESLKIIHVEVL